MDNIRITLWLMVVLTTLLCITHTHGYVLRNTEEKARLRKALEHLDSLLDNMLSSQDHKSSLTSSDNSIRAKNVLQSYKRNEDGPMPYKRNEDGPMPYKRNRDGPVPYKRSDDYLYEDLYTDLRNPLLDSDYMTESKRNEDGRVPYKRNHDDLNDVLRYLLAMEEQAEQQAQKRDVDIPFPF